MKRLILLLLTLFPAATVAQQNQISLYPDGGGSAISAPAVTLPVRDDYRAYLETRTDPKPDSPLAQATTQLPAPKSKRSPSSSSGDEITVPPISGSMVGYVDSAIVGSQVRIRFDDAFDDSAPDRAEFFYAQYQNQPGQPGPDFPGASADVNFQQIYVFAEYAPVSRFSVFTEVPFRWIEPHDIIPGSSGDEMTRTQTDSGISDVRAGIKLAVAVSSSHSLTVQLKAYFPSGNSSLGLGTAHYSFEPSLLYYQRLSQRWAVESQVGDWHPVGGSLGQLFNTLNSTNFAGDVLLYGIGPSYQLIDREHFKLAPVVELYGWHVFGGLQTLDADSVFTSPQSDNFVCSENADTNASANTQLGCSFNAGGTNIVNIKAGVRTSFGNRSSVYVGFGQAVTHATWYEHIIRLEYRYSF